MTMRSKIVGLSRDITETEQNASAPAAGEDEVTSDDGYDADLEEYAEESTYRSGILGYLAPVLLLVAFSTWTAFFALKYWPEIKIGLANERIIALVTTWSVPTLLITVLWLLAMRNSSREATRFGKVASRLRMESVALAARMRTVNGEISLAREFLSQNARELETVGRQSSQKLIESAQMLSAALADSDEKAKKLEAVSQAANTNLEHLRKHLPVVTSAAKDVTNQIGSAGNNAQVQIKSLIASLERVSDAGKSVNAYINNVETRADDLSVSLEQSLSGSAKLLDDKSAEALNRSAEMATLMDSAAQAISSGIAQASGDIDTILAGSQAQIQTSLSDLRGALSEIEAQSQQEDARVRTIITAITAHIQTSAAHIAEVDKAATDQTS